MDIKEIRGQIDEVDDQMLSLFLRRMALSKDVAEYKRARSLPIYNPAREAEILKDVMAKSGEDEAYAYRLFVTLMALSKAKQAELSGGETKVQAQIEKALVGADTPFPETGAVACQGIAGANSEAACEKLLPRGSLVFVKTFDAVFDAVESGMCAFGALPIENNVNGSVRRVYELLRERSCAIARETRLNVRHCLLGAPGASLADVREVLSHEQALGQCGKFVKALGARAVARGNTAEAAREVAEAGDKTRAALASRACAKLYGLSVLSDDVMDSENNYTRFVLIQKQPAIYAGANRVSVILSCPNKPGALVSILSALSARGVNMSKLESYPASGRDFEFRFYMELDADARMPGVKNMLAEMERSCEEFAFLGAYAQV